MPLQRDLREFIECLNSNRVEYLVVGALAVSWHGFPRYSADIDFWVRPTLENAGLLIKAIQDFGLGSLDLDVDDFTKLDRVVQLGQAPNRIDLLTSISGVQFDEAWLNRSSGTL